MAQLARYLPYLECRALNLIRPAEQACDCEKLTLIPHSVLSSTKHIPSHHQVRTDDFFEMVSVAFCYQPVLCKKIFARNVSTRETGHLSPAWHPPDITVVDFFINRFTTGCS